MSRDVNSLSKLTMEKPFESVIKKKVNKKICHCGQK